MSYAGLDRWHAHMYTLCRIKRCFSRDRRHSTLADFDQHTEDYSH
jgi:hypothetical protein